MSKGHGRIERAILEILAQNDSVDPFVIAASVYAVDPSEDDGRTYITHTTHAQHSAVRRALSRLSAQGLAFSLGRGWPDGRGRWADREHATAYAEDLRESFGTRGFANVPHLVALLSF